MDKSKNTRKNYGTAYFATAFLAAFFFEFYWIMTDPYNYFMLLGTGFIMIIMGYLTIDSLLKTKADNDALKAEQNEMMLKAQKAIYIATKKNSKDSSKRQAQNIKAMEIMMNKMISSQQALLEEKNMNGDDMDSLIEQLSESNAKLAKEVQSAITVNQLVKANADLVKNVKEALSANAMSFEQTVDLGAYVNAAVGNPAPKPQATPEKEAPMTTSFTEAPFMEEPFMETPSIETPSIETPSIEAPSVEVSVTDNESQPLPELDIPGMNIDDLLSPESDIPDVNVDEIFMPDHEVTTDIELPDNFEVTADIELPDNFEVTADVKLPDDFEVTTDIKLPDDFEVTTDIELPDDFEVTTDVEGIELHENLEESDEVEISNDTEALENIQLPDIAESTENIELPDVADSLENIELPDVADSLENIEIPEVAGSMENLGLSDETEVLENIQINNTPMDSDLNMYIDTIGTEPMDEDTMSAIENEINMDEMERSEALEEITIPDEMTPELDEAMTEGDPEEIMEEVEPLDLSSGEIPNRQLTDEEIAALFASL